MTPFTQGVDKYLIYKNMQNLSDKITQKIKQEKIKPKARWLFLLKNYFIWGVFVAAVALGGLAFVVIIFGVTTNDWDIYKYLHQSFGQYLFLTLPYYWVGLMMIFLGIAAYYYRHTSVGYKYKVYFILLGSIVASFLLGIILYAFGLGEKLENTFANKLPYYNNFIDHRIEMWSQPESGLLSGKISGVVDLESIILRDLARKDWLVNIKNIDDEQRKLIEKSRIIKVIGKKEGEDEFRAVEIRPWQGRHERCRRHHEREEMKFYRGEMNSPFK